MGKGLDTSAAVWAFIVENFLYGTDNQLTDTTSLMEAGILDSTGLLELIVFLEERYKISIADEELVPENLDTVENIASFVGRKLAEVEQPARSAA